MTQNSDSPQPTSVDASRSTLCSAALPIVDVDQFPICDSYDADCATMSMQQVVACIGGGIHCVNGVLIECEPIRGICREMQLRQLGQ